MSHQLTPERIEATAQSRRFLPFSFGPRFFILLVIGFVWLIPAWWSPRLLAAMFVWDAVIAAAWLLDLLRLPKPAVISVARSFSGPLTLGHLSAVAIDVKTSSAARLEVFVQDETPSVLRNANGFLNGVLMGDAITLTYEVKPLERGTVDLGRAFLRYRGQLGLAERWSFANLQQQVTIYPDLPEANQEVLYLIRSRQQQVERRQQRQRGLGREFEALREYRQGDELRDVAWAATARRRQLITRTYTVERSQAVWIVIDAGRLMRARIQNRGTNFSKLDYAVNAALSVARVAEQNGDRVGLLAYSRSIQAAIAPARGSHQLRLFVDTLADVHTEPVEADHARAAANLLHKQTRRALVVWMTDFAETPALPDVIESAAHVARRHLVLFTAIAQPDLARVAHQVPESEADMFRQAAALDIIDRREILLRQLRHNGVLTMNLRPQEFTTSLVNRYLEIKDRNLL